MNYEIHNQDCRLVMDAMSENSIDAIVCDPPYGLSFMGSGSTGKAAMLSGFNFSGCEISADYCEIARSRIEHAKNEVDNHFPLFTDEKEKD